MRKMTKRKMTKRKRRDQDASYAAHLARCEGEDVNCLDCLVISSG